MRPAPRRLLALARPSHAALVQPSRFAIVWGLLSLCVVLVVGSGISDGVEAVLAEAGAFVALCGVGTACGRGLLPTTAVFYSFWFAWLGIAPLVQLTTGVVAWGDVTALSDHAVVDEALVMTDLALVCFWVGQVAASRFGPHGHGLPSSESSPPGQPVRGWLLAGLILALVVVAPHAISANGGLGTYFTSRTERGETLASAGADLSSTNGAEYALVAGLPVGLSVATAVLALLRVQGGWRGWGRLKVADCAALIIGVAAVAVFANPFSNTRFIGVTGIGALAVLLLRPRSVRAGSVFVAIALVGTLVLYPLANYFRGGEYTQFTLLASRTYSSIDFDGFQQIINTIHYVHDLGFSGGKYVLSAVFYFVPRAIWPNKAIPASIDVAGHANYTFVNLSEPIHAELFLEFGWLGVAVGMFLLGHVLRRADDAWRVGAVGRAQAMVPYLTLAVLGIIRGPLGAQVPIYLTVLSLLWLGLKPARRMAAEARRGPPPRDPGDDRATGIPSRRPGQPDRAPGAAGVVHLQGRTNGTS